jgi:hypothetical protein
MFVSAIRKPSARMLFFPIARETAAPDIATAAGRVTSRPATPAAASYCSAASLPTSGPPISLLLKVNDTAARPGGVAPSSLTFAAAQTTSSGKRCFGSSFESLIDSA